MKFLATHRGTCAKLIAAICTTVLAGCGSSTGSTAVHSTPGEGAAQLVSTMGDVGIFLVTSPIDVRHSGVRMVEVFDAVGRLTQAHREEVFCDGRSRFSLEPLEVLTPVAPDWEPRQRAREGFFFRYRDFDIRNAARFRQNYTVTEVAGSAFVAGRNCKLFTVARRNPGSVSYRVWMDVATGLVLKFEKLDSSGNLRFSSKYESLDTDPDFSGTVWFSGPNNEIELSLALPLETLAGEQIPYPRLLPAGFVLYESFSLTSGAQSYFKQTYTDGVEPLFFLSQPSSMVSVASGKKNMREAPTKPKASVSGVLHVFDMGTSRVAQTTLNEETFCAVGSVDSQALIDMIESALQP